MATLSDTLLRGIRSRWALYIGTMAAANVVAGAIAGVLLLWVLPIPRDPDTSSNGVIIYYTVLIYLIVGALVSVATAIPLLAPVARWRRRGGPPTTAEQSAVMLLPLRQSLMHTVVWLIGAVAFTAFNFSDTPNLAITGGIVLALVCIGTFGSSYMLGERILRPVAARALSDAEYSPAYAPPISLRLFLTWALGTLLPTIGILALTTAQLAGVVKATSTTMAAAVITMCALVVVTSLTLTILTSSHLSDPIRQLRDAVRDMRDDVRGSRVDVYDGSEIGALQVGFNRMATAVEERRRLRNLFGKHVGVDVARNALENGTKLGGEMRFVAVLFVDMIASTRLATARPPAEVVDILNQFFRIVIEVVHAEGGFINKFIGDEVLAVFGAPLAQTDPCTSALRTARRIHEELARRTAIDAGVGVSAGDCVAGNVGASERLEYTVIGDAVNEAARLTERAKLHPTRVSASNKTVLAASADEQRHWRASASLVLRGRGSPTTIAHPCAQDDPSTPLSTIPSTPPDPRHTDDDGPGTLPQYRPPPG